MSGVTFTVQPERKLFRQRSSRRYVVLSLTAEARAASTSTGRRMAIVVDVSRAMEPYESDIRKAVKSLLETLSESDEVALVTFDNEVRTIQPLAQATPEVVRRINGHAKNLEFGSGSRFRKGWLTGCMEIAETTPSRRPPPSHCWVISDGGVQFTSDLAREARDVIGRTGIATSIISPTTFLASFANQGGGKIYGLQGFRRLPPSGDPVDPVAIEVDVPDKVLLEVVGPYRLTPVATGRWRIEVDDLHSGETRHVVLRVRFRDYSEGERAPLTFSLGGDEQSVRFRCAAHADCDREPKNLDVGRIIAVPRAQNMWRLAQDYERDGKVKRALAEIGYARRVLEEYAETRPAQELLEELSAETTRLYATLG